MDREDIISLEELIPAYYDCRRTKRRTVAAVAYEMNYEENLVNLCRRVNDGTYQPGASICFVVTYPKLREVFAASFEDRIIHHYISRKLTPLFEEHLGDRTFSCRKGKGQSYGVNMLFNDIRACSEGYTTDCWIMKMDVKSCFMSVSKTILAEHVDRFIATYYKGADIELIRRLSRMVIFHHPERNCIVRGRKELFDQLPKDKSLFSCDDDRGIAIGNLFSQEFLNLLLNQIDWHIEALGFPYHGRYMDDVYVVGRDKQVMLRAIPSIREEFRKVGLVLHPNKFYIQHYSKGVSFIGTVIKFDRRYALNRTVWKCRSHVTKFSGNASLRNADHYVHCINSYTGYLNQCRAYNVRRAMLSEISSHPRKYVYISGRFEKITMKRKWKTIQSRLNRSAFNSCSICC